MTSRRSPFASVACIFACFALGLALAGTGRAARAQDQSADTPKDKIFARKILMVTIDRNMDALEQMVRSGKPIDFDDASEHADTISVMLMAFPHLFPPGSNQWKANNPDPDPVADTFASPDVWSKFSDFYKRAADASKTAFDISRADKPDELKTRTTELRGACNACHALYLKTQ